MKKLKTTILFAMLLMAINSSFAQTPTLLLSEPEQTDLQNLLTTNPTLVNESVGTTITNATPEIACHPIDDIFNLQCPRYQDEIPPGTNDYTDAIELAIQDADANGGGVILFPGNEIVEITTSIVMKNNITFRASHSMATIRGAASFAGSQLVITSPFVVANVDPEPRENITFENIIFDGDNTVNGISTTSLTLRNINIVNCVFLNTSTSNTFDFSVSLKNATDVHINNCTFRGWNFGITLSERNTRIYIENNTFENTLDNSAIRILGSQSDGFFSDHVWIRGNDIRIGRSPSIIDALDELERDAETGVVTGIGSVIGDPGNPEYDTWRATQKGHHAIEITAGSAPGGTITFYHENIVVENNVALGSDFGFFDGGSADLISLKDIVRLKCVNNVARNSGDLGFAIVNCSSAVVSGNTADRNNSAGIGIFDSRNSTFTGNVLENNGLRRDYIYNGTPYGGILITGKNSYNNIIEGNHFFCYANLDVSLPIPDTYTNRTVPTDYYGIVIRPDFFDVGSGSVGINFSESPFLNKIGNNHYAGQRWGPIYNPVPSTQVNDSFSATSFPKNQDYPLGTWIRNSNMNNSALGWSVVNRVETQLQDDWNAGDPNILVRDPSNSIQKDDVFGVMLDDVSIHWSVINEAIFVPAADPEDEHYEVTLAQFPATSLTAAGIADPASSRTQTPSEGMGRIVILRWLTVTK